MLIGSDLHVAVTITEEQDMAAAGTDLFPAFVCDWNLVLKHEVIAPAHQVCRYLGRTRSEKMRCIREEAQGCLDFWTTSHDAVMKFVEAG